MMNKIQFLTAGESHGKGSLGIIEGIPAGLEISEFEIQYELDRRRPGQSKITVVISSKDKYRFI